MPCYWELSYVCMPTFIANVGQLYFYLDRLPEAIYCCLQTYTVYDVLYYMCLPVFLSLVLIKGSYECIYAIY